MVRTTFSSSSSSSSSTLSPLPDQSFRIPYISQVPRDGPIHKSCMEGEAPNRTKGDWASHLLKEVICCANESGRGLPYIPGPV